MNEIFLVLQAMQLIWLIGLTYTTAVRKPGVEASAAVKKAEEDFAKELADHRDATTRDFQRLLLQINAIETHMKHMPSDEELAELKGAVQAIEERTLGIAESIKGLQRSQQRIEDYLLSSRGGA